MVRNRQKSGCGATPRRGYLAPHTYPVTLAPHALCESTPCDDKSRIRYRAGAYQASKIASAAFGQSTTAGRDEGERALESLPDMALSRSGATSARQRSANHWAPKWQDPIGFKLYQRVVFSPRSTKCGAFLPWVANFSGQCLPRLKHLIVYSNCRSGPNFLAPLTAKHVSNDYLNLIMTSTTSKPRRILWSFFCPLRWSSSQVSRKGDRKNCDRTACQQNRTARAFISTVRHF